ncbi:MAG: hypothetical protein LBJ31_12175 [Treponema sp.]|jgi:hypothetical protein|nr:hypothetical protein [Treponema sp.]
MNRKLNIFERLRQFFINNPHYFVIVLVIFGVFMILAAVKNWEWVFKGNSFNTKKLEGISNMWGRGVARLVAGIGGIGCTIFGIVWFTIYEFYYKH